MYLHKTYPSGAEEWACPTCGRRFIIQWRPVYQKIVLARGHEGAAHTAPTTRPRALLPQIRGEGDKGDEDRPGSGELSNELRAALEELLRALDDSPDADE
jgi:hypothetical protein